MTITTNKNFLSPVGFQLKLDSQKYENVEYFCTAVSLPDLSIAESPTPFRGSNMAMGGDRLNFSNLEVTFNITENMENYIEIYNWLHDIANKGETKIDGTLLILSSHNNTTKEILFRDLFPTTLSAVEFSTQQTEVEYLQASVSFKYTYFEFK